MTVKQLPSSSTAPDGSRYAAIVSAPGWVNSQGGVLPLLDLDFVNNRGFKIFNAESTATSFLTISRASTTDQIDNTSGNWSSVGANILRRSNKGALIEEARTNWLAWSQDLTQVAQWSTPNNITIGTAITAPDGTTSAQKLQDSNTTNTVHNITSQTSTAFTANSTLTYSGFFKTAEYSQISIVVKDAPFVDGFHATFDLTTGAASSTGVDGAGTFTSASSIVYPNGWVRVSLTGVINASATGAKVGLYLKTFAGYAGVVGSGLYTWQQQLETGSFATSPIKTTTTNLQRAADVIDGTISANSLTTQGTLYFEAQQELLGAFLIGTMINSAVGDTNTQIGIINRNAGNMTVSTVVGGVGSNAGTFPVTTTNIFKMAAGWSAGSQRASVNGSAIQAGANTLPNANMAHLDIGSRFGGAHTDNWNGYIRRITIWPTKLSDTTLQAIST